MANVDDIITGDFEDSDWLLLIVDDGLTGLGRVRGYLVFATEADASRMTKGGACDACDLFIAKDIPEDVGIEIMTYADFRRSYGNRMPLNNRVRGREA